jgi:hypothetical protein
MDDAQDAQTDSSKMQPMNAFRNLLLVSAFLCVAANAQARLNVKCDAGSSVHISYVDANGVTQNRTKFDRNENGEVSFVIPAGVTTVNVTAWSDEELIRYKERLPNNT